MRVWKWAVRYAEGMKVSGQVCWGYESERSGMMRVWKWAVRYVEGMKVSSQVCWGYESERSGMLRVWKWAVRYVEGMKVSSQVCWGHESEQSGMMRVWKWAVRYDEGITFVPVSTTFVLDFVRRVWRYQRGNQNPYIEKEQTTQWQKEKVQKDKQRSTKHTYKTKVIIVPTPWYLFSCYYTRCTHLHILLVNLFLS
jgi:hypothetical protein